jgi:hypothetical protein
LVCGWDPLPKGAFLSRPRTGQAVAILAYYARHLEIAFPQNYAIVHNNLGIALAEFNDLPDALLALEAAERGYRLVGLTKEADDVRAKRQEIQVRLEAQSTNVEQMPTDENAS